METIRRFGETTIGVIRSVGRSSGWNFLGEVGRSARPLVAFQVRDKEHEVEMTDSSGFLNRRYEADAAVEAVYEKDMPWSAYLTLGRNLTRRDLWIGIGEVILAVVLWSIGKIFGLPFYPPPIMPARRIILKGYQRARELRKEPTPAEGPQNATVLLSHFFWGGCRKTKGIAFAVVLWKTGVVEKLKYSLFYT